MKEKNHLIEFYHKWHPNGKPKIEKGHLRWDEHRSRIYAVLYISSREEIKEFNDWALGKDNESTD